MSGPTASPKAQDKGGRSKLVSWMKRLTKSKNGPKKQTSSPPKMNGSSTKPEGEANHGSQPNSEAFGDSSETKYSQPAPQGNDNFRSLTNNEGDFVGVQDTGSLAPTVQTAGTDGAASDIDQYSRAATSQTLTGGGADSTFSSTHSSHSLNTTLTTIQSTPSTNQIPNINHPIGHPLHSGTYAGVNHSAQPSGSSTYFHHEYPTTPAPAIPPHLNLTTHVPTTYRSATAHNLLSDNASVLTLASSSHRPQRRNSLDTNASIRAIAPSSVWGGSRESLPLSVLSQNADRDGTTGATSPTPPSTAGVLSGSGSRSASGFGRDERTSLYTSGVGVGAPVLSSGRNSLYTNKSPISPKDKDKDVDSGSITQDRSSLHDRLSLKGSVGGERFAGADGFVPGSRSAGPSSVRSGLLEHGRNDSTTGSIGGLSSPLAGPSEIVDADDDRDGDGESMER